MAVFRVERNTGFTVTVSYTHLAIRQANILMISIPATWTSPMPASVITATKLILKSSISSKRVLFLLADMSLMTLENILAAKRVIISSPAV